MLATLTRVPEHVDIVSVGSSKEISSARALFQEYAASLPIALDYQNFDEELSNLPGNYAPPTGAILLAKNQDSGALGCVALRSLGDYRRCEMKRLYVRPEARQLGIGPALSRRLIELAQEIGYLEMYLDTLPTMIAARALYAKLGFAPTAPYYDSPIPGTVFLKRAL